jgi:hypothetical protein
LEADQVKENGGQLFFKILKLLAGLVRSEEEFLFKRNLSFEKHPLVLYIFLEGVFCFFREIFRDKMNNKGDCVVAELLAMTTDEFSAKFLTKFNFFSFPFNNMSVIKNNFSAN